MPLSEVSNVTVKECWDKIETPGDTTGKLKEAKAAKNTCLNSFRNCRRQVDETPILIAQCLNQCVRACFCYNPPCICSMIHPVANQVCTVIKDFQDTRYLRQNRNISCSEFVTDVRDFVNTISTNLSYSEELQTKANEIAAMTVNTSSCTDAEKAELKQLNETLISLYIESQIPPNITTMAPPTAAPETPATCPACPVCPSQTSPTEPPTTSLPAPTTSSGPPACTNCVKTKSLRMEGDTIIVQENSYNPDTREYTMKVPAHGDRVAVTIIIGEQKMATVFNEYCIVTTPPADFSVAGVGGGETPDDVKEIDGSDLIIEYSFDQDAGELSSEERENLPLSVQVACANKLIRNTDTKPADESTFNEGIIQMNSASRNSRNTTCADPLVRKYRYTKPSKHATPCLKTTHLVSGCLCYKNQLRLLWCSRLHIR